MQHVASVYKKNLIFTDHTTIVYVLRELHIPIRVVECLRNYFHFHSHFSLLSIVRWRPLGHDKGQTFNNEQIAHYKQETGGTMITSTFPLPLTKR